MGLLLCVPSLSHYILCPQSSDYMGESSIPKDIWASAVCLACACVLQVLVTMKPGPAVTVQHSDAAGAEILEKEKVYEWMNSSNMFGSFKIKDWRLKNKHILKVQGKNKYAKHLKFLLVITRRTWCIRQCFVYILVPFTSMFFGPDFELMYPVVIWHLHWVMNRLFKLNKSKTEHWFFPLNILPQPSHCR